MKGRTTKPVTKVIGEWICGFVVIDGHEITVPWCRTTPGFDGLILTDQMADRLFAALKQKWREGRE